VTGSIIGGRSYSGHSIVNLTQGVITLSDKYCLVFNNKDNPNASSRQYTYRFETVNDIHRNVTVYGVVSQFFDKTPCDYKCGGGGWHVDFDIIVKELMTLAHWNYTWFRNEEYLSFGNACVFGAWLKRAYMIYWNNGQFERDLDQPQRDDTVKVTLDQSEVIIEE